MGNFIAAVRVSYRDNPFHNWHHGFSVFHFAYLCLFLWYAAIRRDSLGSERRGEDRMGYDTIGEERRGYDTRGEERIGWDTI